MDIKDYLHYYIGQEIATKEENFNSPGLKLIGICDMGCQVSDEGIKLTYYVIPEEVKLRLRPLSDMTEDERKECAVYGFGGVRAGNQIYQTYSANTFNYLLKQGFDIFGLIPAGLAIDKSKK